MFFDIHSSRACFSTGSKASQMEVTVPISITTRVVSSLALRRLLEPWSMRWSPWTTQLCVLLVNK